MHCGLSERVIFMRHYSGNLKRKERYFRKMGSNESGEEQIQTLASQNQSMCMAPPSE